jgi:hypothetical protein
MTSRIDDLLEHITRLERELEAELDRRRAQWRYRLRPVEYDSSTRSVARTAV